MACSWELQILNELNSPPKNSCSRCSAGSISDSVFRAHYPDTAADLYSSSFLKLPFVFPFSQSGVDLLLVTLYTCGNRFGISKRTRKGQKIYVIETRSTTLIPPGDVSFIAIAKKSRYCYGCVHRWSFQPIMCHGTLASRPPCKRQYVLPTPMACPELC